MRGSTNLHGSARWAEEREIRTMGYFEGKGVYVGGWLKKYAGAALLLQKLKSRPKATQFYLRHTGKEIFFSPHDEKAHGVALAYAALKWGKNVVLEKDHIAFRQEREIRRERDSGVRWGL